MGRIVGLIFPVKEEAVDTAPPAKPRKKAEIKAYLDNLGIEYPDDATVEELRALMPDDDEEE